MRKKKILLQISQLLEWRRWLQDNCGAVMILTLSKGDGSQCLPEESTLDLSSSPIS